MSTEWTRFIRALTIVLDAYLLRTKIAEDQLELAENFELPGGFPTPTTLYWRQELMTQRNDAS